MSDSKVKAKAVFTLRHLLICTVLVGSEIKTLISQYNQNLLHHTPPKFLEKKASYTLAQVLQCPQAGGQPLPLESEQLAYQGLILFSKEHCILCTQSVLKSPLFKKLFIFLSLRQHFERLWGQSGELLGPGRHKQRRQQWP